MRPPECNGADSSMKITVGVVTCERPRFLRKSLETLTTQSRPPDELIVIDDSEDGETERVVADTRASFTDTGTDVIYHHRTDGPNDGTGMTDARNEVLNRASGDTICYIDDDVICPEEWLQAYEAAYEEFPDAASIGGPALAVDEPGDEIELLQTTTNQNRLNKYGECYTGNINWVPSEPVRTSHFRGANMSFRTAVLKEIGGFNPVYKGPAFLEEIDVMARLWKQDAEILYHPDTALYHLNAGDEVDKKYQDCSTWYWQARNNIVFQYHVFPETFWFGLIRKLFYTDCWPGPVWKDLGLYVLHRDERRLQAIRGYFDGLRQVLQSE